MQSYSAGAHYSEQFACTNTKVCNHHIEDSGGLESSVLNGECEQVGWPLESGYDDDGDDGIDGDDDDES